MNKKPVYVAVAAIVVAFLTMEPPAVFGSHVLAEQTTLLYGTSKDLFRQLIRLDIFPALFPDAVQVLPMDASPWERGKLFRSNVTFPFLGIFQTIIRLVKYDEDHLMEFESNSFFIAHYFFEVTLSKNSTSARPKSNLYVVVSSTRSSIFFHTFVKPVLRIIYRNKLYHRLFAIRQITDSPAPERKQRNTRRG